MTYDLLLPLVAFAFVAIATPGPNNLMLLASGANFGVRRAIPHMFGIMFGHAGMLIVLGLGLGNVFELYPTLKTILKVLSVSYMLYLAWKIATSTAPKAVSGDAKPLTLMQAAVFQWVNPKAVATALTAVTVYAPDQSYLVIFTVALVFISVSLPSVSVWTILGQQMQKILTNERRLRTFNITMAVLLVASLYSVVTF